MSPIYTTFALRIQQVKLMFSPLDWDICHVTYRCVCEGGVCYTNVQLEYTVMLYIEYVVF